MTPATIHRLEQREAEARGQTREEQIAEACELYAQRMGAAAGRPWPPEGEEREDFDRSTREALG